MGLSVLARRLDLVWHKEMKFILKEHYMLPNPNTDTPDNTMPADDLVTSVARESAGMTYTAQQLQ